MPTQIFPLPELLNESERGENRSVSSFVCLPSADFASTRFVFFECCSPLAYLIIYIYFSFYFVLSTENPSTYWGQRADGLLFASNWVRCLLSLSTNRIKSTNINPYPIHFVHFLYILYIHILASLCLYWQCPILRVYPLHFYEDRNSRLPVFSLGLPIFQWDAHSKSGIRNAWHMPTTLCRKLPSQNKPHYILLNFIIWELGL